jgi:hypothetical protein
MCDEQATKKFRENGYEPSDSSTSHYDPAANVCYIQVNAISGDKFPVITSVVYDPFGGRVHAPYAWVNAHNKQAWEVAPTTCQIQIPGKPVEYRKSSDEFDQLVDKYFGVTE